MPLYPSSFFVPPAGVPFLIEDKYMRGGYRVLATVTDRDAIATAARKAGMLVRTQDDGNIYELVGGTANTNWQLLDITKYIKLGAPLNVVDGKLVLTIAAPLIVGDTGLSIDVSNLFKDQLSTFLKATDADNGKSIVYDSASKSFVLKTITSGSTGPTYSNAAPITLSNTNVIGIDYAVLFGEGFANSVSAAAADDGKVLTYDHGTRKLVLRTAAAGGTTLARAKLSKTTASLAANGVGDFTMALGKTAMIVALSVDKADVVVECHSTSARNDVNPYKFLSSASKLTDDGTSVLEDGSIQYNRRYAFVANLESTPVADTYWRITNKSSSAQTVTLNITYLKFE